MNKIEITESKFELIEDLKDLTAAVIAQDVEATKKNSAPKDITVSLPYELFELLKSTVLTALLDVSDALEDKDKQHSIAKEIACKAYLFSYTNYNGDLYKKLLGKQNLHANKEVK